MNKRRVIFIESQVTTRDLDSRILLAYRFASEGYEVYLGRNKGVLRASAVASNGVMYFADNFTDIAGQGFDRIKRNENLIFAVDEESIAYDDPEIYSLTRVSCRAINLATNVFATNDIHKSVIHSYCNEISLSEKVVTTGLPRFDLLTHKYRGIYDRPVDALRRRYGKFILVTSHGVINNKDIIDKELGKLRKKYQEKFNHKLSDEDLARIGTGMLENSDLHAQFFRDLLEVICRLPMKHTFVVRPKGDESAEKIENAIGKKIPRNMVFDSSYNIQPWVLAADAMVHCNSGSGVDGYMAGIPVIMYKPAGTRYKYYSPTPTSVSHVLDSKNDLEEALSAVLRGELSGVRDSDMVVNKTKMATDQIFRVIDSRSDGLSVNVVNAKKSFFRELNSFSYEFFRRKNKGGNIKLSYVVGMFHKIQELSADKRDYKIEWLGDELIMIVKAE